MGELTTLKLNTLSKGNNNPIGWNNGLVCLVLPEAKGWSGEIPTVALCTHCSNLVIGKVGT